MTSMPEHLSMPNEARALSVSTACTNWSCGPPKPGGLLLSGVRRCRRRSAGGPLGPDGAPEGLWGRRRVPMGPYINPAPIRDSRAIRRAPSGPVVPKRGSDGNPSEPDMAPDGTQPALTDHSTVPYGGPAEMPWSFAVAHWGCHSLSQ